MKLVLITYPTHVVIVLLITFHRNKFLIKPESIGTVMNISHLDTQFGADDLFQFRDFFTE